MSSSSADIDRHDVVVVGYGPVGMVTAGLLAQHGLDVAVVERFPRRYPLSRAGHFDGETMRAFQTLGIAGEVELVARPLLEWSLMDADMELLTTLTLGQDGAGWKASYLSYQPQIEEIIDRRVRDLGVRVHMDTTAEELRPDTDGVDLVVRRDGARATIRASYVVGADGANSFVRSALGIGRRDLGFRALQELVLDVRLNDPDVDLPELPEVFQVLDPERPVLAGRWSGPATARFEFASREQESRDHLLSDEFSWGQLARWGLTPRDGTIERRAVYSFESLLAERWRDGRVLLAGDAAHTMPPFMGQGVCSGYRDALNLAWKIAAVLAGDADDSLLDTYESERAPHVEELTRASMALGEMVSLRDPELARQRDEALRSGSVPPQPEFPRLGPGIVTAAGPGDGSPVDGRLALQARVAFDGRLGRFDEFGTPGWKIVSRHPVPAELFGERGRAVAEGLGMAVFHVSRGPGPGYYQDIDGDFDLWFRRTGRKVLILRPDNYVFGSGATVEDLPSLLDGLADTLAAYGWKTAN
ncbi:bifunctional 3-(3-hydroxy-phenyl)propionate/3-hydroxycinnamic acid hydroxylase [Actinoplanes sp. NPDC049265]|uniref:bifunctional 3-(3-hydroxy-phenyl)propionate/3-hydroxycinnamic acid hydroxylase n=1 Tax=Actinoplanes sp. NPDC049265 TaxID=3363902 RepID=UPI00371CAB2C